jgi:cysteine synthase A
VRADRVTARAGRVCRDILEAVGDTPIIELRRLNAGLRTRILVKFEGLNPGGSIKTRTAYAMITAAEKAGLLSPDSVIVEPTSGNQGIGMAMVCAVKGYRCRIVILGSVSEERKKLIRAYGAELVEVPTGRDIKQDIEAALRTAYEMRERDPKVFIPNQFENPSNPAIHRSETVREIIEAVDGPVDAFVSGIGTGGTITGIGEELKSAYPGCLVFLVEPTKAAVFGKGTMGHHNQQGIGDGVIPPILNTGIFDDVIMVSDEDAMATARRLAREEGLLCGVSSGTNVWGALRVAERLGPGKTIVTILPDTGERYLSIGLFE